MQDRSVQVDGVFWSVMTYSSGVEALAPPLASAAAPPHLDYAKLAHVWRRSHPALYPIESETRRARQDHDSPLLGC